MVSVFDLKKLQELLRDFYTLTKIRIVVYDERFRELCSYPAQRAPICTLIRTNLKADEACRNCDVAACKAASRQTAPYIYTCHAGLTEAVSTLRVDSVIIGYISFGHLFAYASHESGYAHIWQQVAQYGLDADALKSACRTLPTTTREYILSAANILNAVASFVAMERMVILKPDSLAMQLEQYLTENFTKPIGVKTLCDTFHIGRTKLYELLHRNYGCGLGTHIRKLRMEKARTLLEEHPEMTIAEVATACGYGDYNYFIAVFSKHMGLPPRQYQKQKER